MTETVQKYYISYNTVHKVCQQGASRIIKDNFQPDVILAVGGGGFVPARMLRTHLRVPMKAVSVELYDDKTDKINEEGVKTIQWVGEHDVRGKNVLIVDEIDDTRTTLCHCVREVSKMGPNRVGVFVLHNKKKAKRECGHWTDTGFEQEKVQSDFEVKVDYYSAGEEIDDVWIVYPWESTDIDDHEVLSANSSSPSS